MILLPDGSLVACGAQKVHHVKLQWPTPAPGFHQFPQLPTEVRFMIWKLALPGPRVLSLSIDREPQDRNRCMKWTRPETEPVLYVRRRCWLGSDENPYFHNLAHLCRESRRFFLESYSRLKFRNTRVDQPWNKVRNSQLRPDHTGRTARIVPPKGYIDFSRDTLEVSEDFLDALEERDGWVDLTQVENFAFCLADKLPVNPREERLRSSGWLWSFIKKELPALKKLTFFLGAVYYYDVEGFQATLNFLNIDGDTIDIISRQERSYFPSEVPKAENVQAWLKAAKKIVHETKQKHQTRVLTDDSLKSVDFEVALISTRLRATNAEPEQVWLAPAKPKYHGVSFSTLRPGAVGKADKQYIHAFEFGIRCHPDGTPLQLAKKPTV
jgi:hypothetical protein